MAMEPSQNRPAPMNKDLVIEPPFTLSPAEFLGLDLYAMVTRFEEEDDVDEKLKTRTRVFLHVGEDGALEVINEV